MGVHAAVAAFADIAQYSIDMDGIDVGTFRFWHVPLLLPSNAVASEVNLRLSAEACKRESWLCFAPDRKNSRIEAYARRLARAYSNSSRVLKPKWMHFATENSAGENCVLHHNGRTP